jgi:hypothetical protein
MIWFSIGVYYRAKAKATADFAGERGPEHVIDPQNGKPLHTMLKKD